MQLGRATFLSTSSLPASAGASNCCAPTNRWASPERSRRINGRNALTWEEKFALDVWYVDHHSLWLDVKILGMTVWQVFKREGINQPGQATMAEFLG